MKRKGIAVGRRRLSGISRRALERRFRNTDAYSREARKRLVDVLKNPTPIPNISVFKVSPNRFARAARNCLEGSGR